MSAVIEQAGGASVLVPKGQRRIAHPATLAEQVEQANFAMPRGQNGVACSTTNKRGAAIDFMPTEANACVPPPAPIAAQARTCMPKGQEGVAARQPHEDREAKWIMPKGQSWHASDLPPLDAGEAMCLMPNGHAARAAPASIQTLRELHRKRQDFHRAEKSLTLQVKAICRRLCGGDKDEADKLYTAMQKGADDAMATLARDWTEPFIQSRAILEGNRKSVEKSMEKVAKTLPVAGWVASIKGFGIGSLAAIVGEAGDLSNYPTHSHLWKRLGLAVIDGGRQRCVAGVDALKHGYSPSRRSVVWNIGQCIFKAQSQRIDKETGEIKVEAGDYRKLYDARKEYELPRVETKGHAHNRAVRYMEKRVIRDLWRAWK